jgi:molybdate-binding protein
VSYRHLWGRLKHWEATLCHALVVWQRGQPARLTPLAEGRCRVAGFHAPALARGDACARALKALLVPGRHKLIGTMRRRQGLMLAPGNPLAVATLRGAAQRGLQAAAQRCGLAFVPLAEEDYFLACLADALDQPAVTLLRAVLAEPAWAAALAAEPGYAPGAEPGAVLSLTRALPWWRFRSGAATRPAGKAARALAASTP